MRKFLKISLLAAVLILTCCIFPTTRADAVRMLTFDRAVQINDYQLVLEFSEPIAINLLGENRGPCAAVRIVGNNNTLAYDGDTPLQWPGCLEYTDSKHDKLLFTLLPAAYGVDSITDITHFRGSLVRFSGKSVAMCLEEVPFQTLEPVNNGTLDNITTADGEVYMWSNRPGGWEGTYLPITVDFDYEIDMSKTESIENVREREKPVFELGAGSAAQSGDETPGEVITETVIENDPLVIAAIIGGGVLLAAAALVIIISVSRKSAGAHREAGKTE